MLSRRGPGLVCLVHAIRLGSIHITHSTSDSMRNMRGIRAAIDQTRTFASSSSRSGGGGGGGWSSQLPSAWLRDDAGAGADRGDRADRAGAGAARHRQRGDSRETTSHARSSPHRERSERSWNRNERGSEQHRRRSPSSWSSSSSSMSSAPPASSIPKPIGEFIYGTHPVLGALSAKRRPTFHTLYIQSSGDRSEWHPDHDPDADTSLDEAVARDRDRRLIDAAVRDNVRDLRIVRASKHDLNMMSGNRPHNGYVLDVDPLHVPVWKELPPPPEHARSTNSASHSDSTLRPPVWVLLDEVMDPQNLGAIIRSSLYLGVTGIVVCTRNSAPLSAVCSKASSGAMEMMPLVACSSTPQFLRQCRRAAFAWPPSSSSTASSLAFSTDAADAANAADDAPDAATGWHVVGMSLGDGAIDCREWRITRPTILVVGNEGKGMRTLVSQCCDQHVVIQRGTPSLGADTGANTESSAFLARQLVDSLNVSNAVAIALFQALR